MHFALRSMLVLITALAAAGCASRHPAHHDASPASTPGSVAMARDADAETFVFFVSGMTCGDDVCDSACDQIRSVEGVTDVQIDRTHSIATVRLRPGTDRTAVLGSLKAPFGGELLDE